MRLLHVNTIAMFQGGVERILHDTAQGLAERGFEQALWYEEGEADLRMTAQFSRLGREHEIVEDFRPDLVLVHKASLERIKWLVNYFPVVRMVHDHDLVCLRRHKYFPISKRVCEKPAGVSCLLHGCIVQRDPGGHLPLKIASLSRQKREIALNKLVKGLVVGSNWMRNSLIENGFEANQISVIPPVPRALMHLPNPTATASERNILYVGQIIRGKGIDLMLRALAQLEGDWSARFVGTGNFIGTANALAEKLGIAHQVEFVGQVEHEALNNYYDQARCVVVPSRWPEPFGMVGIEAMARQRAVIGFAVGGIPDWIEDNVNGLLVAESDIVGLKIAVQKLMDDRHLAQRLAKAGRERVAKEFTHQNYLNKVQAFLEQASDDWGIDVCR